VVTRAVLPTGKWPLPMGKKKIVCDRLPRGKLPSGSFYRYVKENKEITHDSNRTELAWLTATRGGLSQSHSRKKLIRVKLMSRQKCFRALLRARCLI